MLCTAYNSITLISFYVIMPLLDYMYETITFGDSMTLYTAISALMGSFILLISKKSGGFIMTRIIPSLFALLSLCFALNSMEAYLLKNRLDITYVLEVFEAASTPVLLVFRENFFSSYLTCLVAVTLLITTMVAPRFCKNGYSINSLNADVFFLGAASIMVVNASNITSMLPAFIFISLFMMVLVRFYNNKPRALQASFTVFIINIFADSIILLAVINTMYNPEGSLLTAVFALIAFLIKSGLAGFGIWTAETSEAPAIGSTFIGALIMPITSLAMLYQIKPMLHEYDISQIALFFIIIGIFLPALAACMQFRIKRILSYSSLSQISLILLTFYISSDVKITLAILTLHLLGKGLTSIGYTNVSLAASEEEDIRNIGGVGKILKTSAVCCLTGGIMMIANCFLTANISDSLYYKIICILATSLTVIYTTRPFLKVFCGKLSGEDAVIARITKEPFGNNMLCFILLFVGLLFTFKTFSAFGSFDLNFDIILAAVVILALIYSIICFHKKFYMSSILENIYPSFYLIAKEGFGSYKIYHSVVPIMFRKIGNNLSNKTGKSILYISKTSGYIGNVITDFISLKNTSNKKLYITIFISSIVLIITSYFTLKGINTK